jgi:hypothetical protein
MKTYPSTTLDEFYRDKFIAVDLVELYLPTGTLYLNSGGFELTYGGNTYTAQGDFMGFSTVSEEFDVKVGKFSIYLSGVGTSADASLNVRRFLDTDFEGRKVVIRKAFLDFDPMTLDIIDTPIIIFEGQIFNVSIVEGRNSASITVDCSTLFADFERTAGRKTNNGSNQLFQGNTSDTAFEKAGFVGQTEFLWGRLVK